VKSGSRAVDAPTNKDDNIPDPSVLSITRLYIEEEIGLHVTVVSAEVISLPGADLPTTVWCFSVHPLGVSLLATETDVCIGNFIGFPLACRTPPGLRI